MVMTSPTPTSFQQVLSNLATVFETALPAAALDAITVYTAINSTPTVANLVTLANAVHDAKTSAGSEGDLAMVNLLETLVRREIATISIGTPESGLILSGYQFPTDDLGVTFETLKLDLITNLSVPGNVDTVAHLAATIFYTIKVASPAYSLASIQADIQATINTGVILTDLVAAILVSLTAIGTATADNLRDALYGDNIMSADEAHLVLDIHNKEELIDLIAIKTNLLNACANAGINSVATAIFNSMLGTTPSLITLTKITKDVTASVDRLGGLSTLKANIINNLNGINNLDLTHEVIKNALFANNALISSDLYDLTNDAYNANQLLILQNIRTSLITATTSFTGTAGDLATAIRTAITSNGGVVTLTAQELENDINGSVAVLGTLATLVNNINTALVSLDTNHLTATLINNSLFAVDKIISGHALNVLHDLEAAQEVLNYDAMRVSLLNAINDGGVVDKNTLADAIYDNKGGANNLTLVKLKEDIQYTLDGGMSFNDLKSALITALTNAEPTAEGIASALYSINRILTSDLSAATLDTNTVETAIDYKNLITLLIAKCNLVGSSITTPAGFVAALKDVLDTYAGSSIASNVDAVSVALDIQTLIDNGTSLSAIATGIKTDLTTADTNKNYNSLSITNAIFDHISPLELGIDVTATERLMNLYEIQQALITVFNGVTSVGSTPSTVASSIITAIKNGLSFSTTLTQDKLADDITATLAIRQIGIVDLANYLKGNLQGINTNSLTDVGIKSALFSGVNGIMPNNIYNFKTELTAAETAYNYHAIKAALITYLDAIATNETDISSVTMARGILNTIKNLTGSNYVSTISVTSLSADIAYTLATDSTDFTANWMIAEALVTQLQSAENTKAGIQGAMFDPSYTIVVSSGNSGANLNDATSFATYVEAAANNLENYLPINQAIVTAIGALVSLTATTVATAIADVLYQNRALDNTAKNTLISLLTENINATGGANTAITALTTKLNLLTSSTQSLDDVVNAVFSTYGGALSDSTIDAINALADIDATLGGTNDLGTIATNLKNALIAIGTPTVPNVATAIVDKIHYIAPGSNNYLVNPTLALENVMSDIQKALTVRSITISQLRDNLVVQLQFFVDYQSTIDQFKHQLYSNDGPYYTLINAPSQFDDYKADLETAAADHLSFTTIRDSFQTPGTYTTSAELAADIILKLTNNTGISLELSVEELIYDIDTTLTNNPSLTLTQLAINVFGDVYSITDLVLADQESAAEAIATAIFGTNIENLHNANLIISDLRAYETTREATYYGQINDNFVTAFNSANNANFDTTAEFTNLFINTLGAESPEYTSTRALQDAEYYIRTGSIPVAGNSFHDGLNNARQTTAAGIVSKFATALGGAFPIVNAGSVYDSIDDTKDSRDARKIYVIAGRIKTAIDALSIGFTSEDLATAIVHAITPVLVSSTPNLLIDALKADIDYTVDQGTSLTTLRTNLDVALTFIMQDHYTLASILATNIFDHLSGNIYLSPFDADSFKADSETATDTHNSYGILKTSLGTITDTSADNAAASVHTTLELRSNSLTQVQLASDFTANIVTTIEDLIGVITTGVGTAVVSDVATSAKNLAEKFFNPNALVPSSHALSTDFTTADEVDDTTTLVSAIGDGVCRAGATHTVYKCQMVDDLLVVGDLITRNNCTVSSAENSARACDAWAAQPTIDLYASYDGVTCSNYLGAVRAASYCKAGLDYLAS